MEKKSVKIRRRGGGSSFIELNEVKKLEEVRSEGERE